MHGDENDDDSPGQQGTTPEGENREGAEEGENREVAEEDQAPVVGASVIVNFPLAQTYNCVKDEDTSIYEIRRSDNPQCLTRVDGTCCGLVLVEGENKTLVSKEILSLSQCSSIIQSNNSMGSSHLSDDHKSRAGGQCTLQP